MQELSLATSAVDISQLEGWLPVDAVIREGRPGLLWLDMRGIELAEPFFAQTVERCQRELPNCVRFTDLDLLLQLDNETTSGSPRGLIFHASRCGSTALANSMKALDNTIVFSEPYIVDKLISRLFSDTAGNKTKELLYLVLIRGAVNALMKHRSEASCFIKFAPTSSLQLAKLRRIWPEAPWIFLYRDPIEILVSNLNDPPEWLAHHKNLEMSAFLLGSSSIEVQLMGTEEFGARLLARVFEVAADNVCSAGRLMNYNELTAARVFELIEFFGREPSRVERARIESTLNLYSKDRTTTRVFVTDSESKQTSASGAARSAVERWAQPAYEKLENLKTKLDERGLSDGWACGDTK